MSYRGPRPVCAICQLNADAITALGETAVHDEVVERMRERRDELWPEEPEA